MERIPPVKRFPAHYGAVVVVSIFSLVLLAFAPTPVSTFAADCNGNDINDKDDVQNGASLDCNANGIPDECEHAPLSFGLGPGLPVEGAANAMITADFNGDGLVDLATANSSSNLASISLLVNQGDGEFVTVTSQVGSGFGLFQLAAGHIDADGRLDIVARAPNGVWAVFGQKDATFTEPRKILDFANGQGVAVADFDGDGKTDVVATTSSRTVYVLAGNGDGTFGDPVTFTVGTFPAALVTVDVDGDGDTDIVTANSITSDVSILVNDGKGNLTVREPFPAGGSRPRYLVTADFNADANPDLALGTNAGIRVFLNQGDGTYGGPVAEFAVRPTSLWTADFDDDGDIDLISGVSGEDAVAILLNDGTGQFRSSQFVHLISTPFAMRADDFDGDGDADLAAVTRNDARSSAIVVVLNGEPGVLAMNSKTFQMSSDPHSVALRDFDGDGDLDVATCDGNEGSVTILSNDGAGNYTVTGEVRTGRYLNSVTAADLDSDGDTDIITGDHGGNELIILRNGGNARFLNQETVVVGSQPFYVTTADMNRDGRPDLLSANDAANTVSIVLNIDGRQFADQIAVRVGAKPESVAVADFDGDNELDLAVTNFRSSQLMVLFNEGNVTFAPPVNYDVQLPRFVTTADFNGDGSPDMATANDANSISVLLNNGRGVFGRPDTINISQAPYSLEPADLNDDGFIDIVSANQTPNTVSVILNSGAGVFSFPFHFGVGTDPRFVAAGDVDEDGDLDLVAHNHTSADITVLYNEGSATSLVPYLEKICTPADFHLVTTESPFISAVKRSGKYLAPADPDNPALVPLVFQNTQLYQLHIEFMKEAFPDHFPSLTDAQYDALVNRRATREYFIGEIFEIAGPDGIDYAFNVLAGFFDDPTELPTLEEVGAIYDEMSQHLTLRPLYYFPNTQKTRDDAKTWVNPGFPILLDDPDSNLPYQAYTQGVGFGRLLVLNEAEFEDANDTGALSFQNILVTNFAPRDIEGVVSGVITGERQSQGSHLAIRTARRGTPNAFVRDSNTEFMPYDGKLVRLQVRQTDYLIREATLEEAQTHWAENQPRLTEDPQVDPDFTELVDFDQLAALDNAAEAFPPEARFGGKATNMARLQQVLTGPFEAYKEKGFAIPVHYYLEFLNTNHIRSAINPGEIVTYENYLSELFADPQFETSSTYRFSVLETLRDHMEDDSIIPAELVTRLARRVEEVFESTLLRVRCRSSSNVEDALEFNGAGLYDSTSACAADDLDLDGDGPSRCDNSRDNERGFARALRRVWASLWNFRAFEERAYYGIDQKISAMGILVNRAFVAEELNGVAFTGDPNNRLERRYVVTAQVSDISVVSPPPGVIAERNLLLVEDGEVVEIVRAEASSLAEPGKTVMTDDQLRELGRVLYHLDENFPIDLGPYDRDDVLLDIEFKFESNGDFAIKQVRPFLLTSERPPTPTFFLDVPPGTALCGAFQEQRSPERAYELKSTIQMIPGRIELPTTSSQLDADLFSEVLVGPEQLVATPTGPGTFDIARVTEGKITRFRFDFRQEFTLPGGELFEINWFEIRFQSVGDDPLTPELVIDAQYLRSRLNMQGALLSDENFDVTYASCTRQVLPLWEITADTADGTSIRLLERFDPPIDPNSTGPAALVHAELNLSGQKRVVSDYWHLVYAAGRHNVAPKYWVFLEPAVVLDGLEKPVHVVEVKAPEPALETREEVNYRDADFAVIHTPDVTTYNKRPAPVGAPEFIRGDANADGGVNMGDAITILNHLFAGGAVPVCRETADANDDGGINLADAIGVLNHLFGGAGPLPEPAGSCGVDPTPGDLGCEGYPGCG